MKTGKVIRITSRKKERKNHMIIVMNLSNEVTERETIREIKKMAQKMNQLLEKDFSYEVHLTIRGKN